MGIKKNFLVDAGLEANLASSFANTVAVTGAVTLSNTLSVSNITTAVTVGGLITGTSGLTITGTANASVALNVGANVNLSTSRVNVGNSTVNTFITSTAVETDGTLTVLGATSLSNTLGVTGNATLSNTLAVTGNATLSNTLAVTGAATFSNNVTVSGDLTVTGTTTYINTATLNVADNLINLNSDLGSGVAPSENAGIEVNRGSSANVQLMWDESNDRWSTNGQPFFASTVTVNVGAYPVSNTVGQALGDVAQRWNLTANTIATSGIFTAGANVNMSNNHLINSRLTRYTESVTANTSVGSTYAVDLSTANIFDLTLTANVTISVTNPPSSGIAQGATIILRQDATGGRTVTFPATFKTTDGIAANSAVSTGANKIDVFTIVTVDGGTVYLASQAMANVG
jgi:fibronectin-binding autotransporter adhesin